MTTTDGDPTGPDVNALRAAIEKTDRLLAKNLESRNLMLELKRSLVMRLLRTQHPHLSIDEEAKLLKSYGLAVAPPKT